MAKKPKKKKPVGRPSKKHDAVLPIHMPKALRDNFMIICTVNKPRTTMSEAIRHYMDLCIKNRTVLGLDVDE